MAQSHRLSSHVQPLHYKITVKPDLAQFTFNADQTISLQISKPTRQLVLHAVDLKISLAELIVGKQKTPAAKITYQVRAETVTIVFPKPVRGKANLHLTFDGLISEQLRGLYRSNYRHKNQDKQLAVTQFESTDARRMIPCFDEPSHKAKFSLEVIIPKHLQAVSNTVEQFISPHTPGYKIIRFAPTPKMSSYLLALIIGELEHVTGKSKRGVKIRIHTTPGKKSQAQFALNFTKRALDYLENYFGIKYPLPVLDLLAIPDFAAGAMENWGAITFRETLLLVDDAHSPFNQKQRVAEVIAHELVHQWFGNLVTMEWWTHLWLNESFATYMAYHVVDKLEPDWNYWTKFALDEQAFALQQDSLHATHPVEVPVKHPDEIAEIFDAISYAKGASVLRMLANYIGEDNFRAGLSWYLQKHSYKNTSSTHLWEAFEKISGMPVQKLMRIWTLEAGFPVLEARASGNQIELTQSEFKLLPRTNRKLWSVPLRVQTSQNQISEPYLIYKEKQAITLPVDFKFANLDYDDGSLTVVKYDMALLARLLPKFEDQTLTTLDRLALVRDNHLLAKSGHLPTDVYLEILQFTTQESSFVIWSEIANSLSQLQKILAGTSAQVLLTDYQLKLYSSLLQRKDIGLESKNRETHNIAMLRALAFQGAGLAGSKPVISKAKQYFTKLLRGKTVNPNLRAAVYAVITRHGNRQDLAKLISHYKNVELAIHKQQILFGLIAGAAPKSAKTILELIYSEAVRDQDRIFAIAAAINNPLIKTQAWQALIIHWSELIAKFGSSKLTGTLLSGCSSFNNPAELKAFKNFLKGKKLPGAKQAIAQTLEKIQINIAWLNRDFAIIKRYLSKK